MGYQNASSVLINEGTTIYLRELTENDANDAYCKWLNDPVVNKYLETRKATIEDLRKYIHLKKESPNCVFFGIFLKENDKHIGNVKLEPIDFERKTSYFGILIGEKEQWGKGIGTEATRLAVEYAFNVLHLKEVKLGVIAENKAAIRTYKKVGFEIKKIERKKIKHDATLYDQVIMGIENHT
jgi:ribosomal-protein-alanine N-acetyltransferase